MRKYNKFEINGHPHTTPFYKFNRLSRFIYDYQTKLCLEDESKPGFKPPSKGLLDYNEYSKLQFGKKFSTPERKHTSNGNIDSRIRINLNLSYG